MRPPENHCNGHPELQRVRLYRKSPDVGVWNKNMGQKWRKIRRRCSSFNAGGKSIKGDENRGVHLDCDNHHDRGFLIPSSPQPSPAVAVQDIIRSRINRMRKRCPPTQPDASTAWKTTTDSSTFYVPSPLSTPEYEEADDDHNGPCSLPAIFDNLGDNLASRCRIVETPSSCSSGRGTDDSDRSSVSYSEHGFNSIATGNPITTSHGFDQDTHNGRCIGRRPSANRLSLNIVTSSKRCSDYETDDGYNDEEDDEYVNCSLLLQNKPKMRSCRRWSQADSLVLDATPPISDESMRLNDQQTDVVYNVGSFRIGGPVSVSGINSFKIGAPVTANSNILSVTPDYVQYAPSSLTFTPPPPPTITGDPLDIRLRTPSSRTTTDLPAIPESQQWNRMPVAATVDRLERNGSTKARRNIYRTIDKKITNSISTSCRRDVQENKKENCFYTLPRGGGKDACFTIMTVKFHKGPGNKCLGFSIVGGTDSPKGTMGIYVKTIFPNGQAADLQSLKEGDEILTVNNKPLHGLSHQEAIAVFKEIKLGEVALHIGRRVPKKNRESCKTIRDP
ncbi:uncharacterized protein LOC126906232 isoform X2 [Daktulosphaira vitifoliae]|uniref:uncharacterized protein LOC126906232 isoform X2 n=1 Tax=Daktulosphaira vitifoliae TaxID=58002 RepID=UPI0021A9A03D|nr:uncharacterized protein LOC126906232 isoform X2 [Daktulosphaira vitifoliae]